MEFTDFENGSDLLIGVLDFMCRAGVCKDIHTRLEVLKDWNGSVDTKSSC